MIWGYLYFWKHPYEHKVTTHGPISSQAAGAYASGNPSFGLMAWMTPVWVCLEASFAVQWFLSEGELSQYRRIIFLFVISKEDTIALLLLLLNTIVIIIILLILIIPIIILIILIIILLLLLIIIIWYMCVNHILSCISFLSTCNPGFIASHCFWSMGHWGVASGTLRHTSPKNGSEWRC